MSTEAEGSGPNESVTRTRPPAAPPISVGPGTRLLNDKFELEQELGKGGMGVVYRALDLNAVQLQDPNPRVAIKVLSEAIRSWPAARLAMQREVSRARQLAHPNIVRVHEFYEDRGVSFITMELLEGVSWDTLIRQHPQGLPLTQARPLIEQLCAALTYAHTYAPERGVIHSDLKPQNLFLTDDGQVKVLDFGIAAPVRRSASSRQSDETLYNPREMGARSDRYASPEMFADAPADPRDDVFAVGCIVYELLSGEHPFGGVSVLQAARENQVPPPIPVLSPAQNQALRAAMQPRRSERTPSIAAFAESFWNTPPPRQQASPLWIAGAAAAVVAAVLIVLWVQKPTPASRLPTSQAPASSPSTAATIPFATAQALAAHLRMVDPPFRPGSTYSRAELLAAVARAPREAVLGSSPQQIGAALALCRETSSLCQASWFADETFRKVVLKPYVLDPTAVTVAAFREFIASTGYRTQADKDGGAYGALVGEEERFIRGGNWTNAAGTGTPSELSAVVAVSFDDAQAYCEWRGERLPTEDEWEYAARGPAQSIFPWGDDPRPARIKLTTRPAAADGPAEGVDGRLRGLSGNVWEWVNTPGPGGKNRKILKGGSWLEQTPANKRAAGRRSEVATRADADSGFRCARSVAQWPDAAYWVSQKP